LAKLAKAFRDSQAIDLATEEGVRDHSEYSVLRELVGLVVAFCRREKVPVETVKKREERAIVSKFEALMRQKRQRLSRKRRQAWARKEDLKCKQSN
jgi:hypothetical protein